MATYRYAGAATIYTGNALRRRRLSTRKNSAFGCENYWLTAGGCADMVVVESVVAASYKLRLTCITTVIQLDSIYFNSELAAHDKTTF